MNFTCKFLSCAGLTEAIRELTNIVKDLKNITVSLKNELKEEISELKTEINGNPVIFGPPLYEIDSSVLHPCGGTPGWRNVAYLNMTRPQYDCPAGWRLHPEPARACGRASYDGLTCDSAFFTVPGGSYSKICGRVIGYQFGKTAAFLASQNNRQIRINESYVTGVSITHGSPRDHVWTYAAGRFEGTIYYNPLRFHICPCEYVSDIFVPDYVGAYWYCESGDNREHGSKGYNLYSDDPLWDGEGCRLPGKCCQFYGPLYFTRTLHNPASDPIEVRICNYYTSQYSDVLVSHLELYVK